MENRAATLRAASRRCASHVYGAATAQRRPGCPGGYDDLFAAAVIEVGSGPDQVDLYGV